MKQFKRTQGPQEKKIPYPFLSPFFVRDLWGFGLVRSFTHGKDGLVEICRGRKKGGNVQLSIGRTGLITVEFIGLVVHWALLLKV